MQHCGMLFRIEKFYERTYAALKAKSRLFLMRSVFVRNVFLKRKFPVALAFAQILII